MLQLGNGARSRSNLFTPKVAAQRRDAFSFSEFWSFGADDRCAAVASAALMGDLEMLKDICDSDDCSIFDSPGVGVEETNLPDVLEHWTRLREYVELAFLRAAIGSSRRQNLQSVLLWLGARESMEAFDVAFGPMKEPELDGLRKLTLTGKIFHVFSLQDWKGQLRLIDGCYKGHQNMVSELLKVGAPDEISPCLHLGQWALLTIHGWRHGFCVLCWRLVFFPDWLRVSRRNVFCSVRDCSHSGNTTSCCRYIIPLVCFVLCKCNACNGSFVSSECGSACRYAARDGERWR